jgi:hypothetical protein
MDCNTELTTIPHQPPCVCPHCGKPLASRLCSPFLLETSGLLDWILLIEADLRHVKQALEEATL